MLQVGSSFYKYSIIKHLGNGNFGDVYLMEDTLTKQRYAIKVMQIPAEVNSDDLLREAQIGSRAEHSNVAKINEANIYDTDGTAHLFLALPYCPEGDISKHCNPNNFFDIMRTKKIILDVLSGLDYLHNQLGVYHNDIKPKNILVKGDSYILSDYGISCYMNNIPQNIKQYSAHGAPEKKVNIQTDIYQVGCTFYRLLHDITNSDVSKDNFAVYIPDKIIKILKKSLHQDPKKRYQTANEMKRELEQVIITHYWDIDKSGEWIGHSVDSRYQFSFRCDKGRFIPFIHYLKTGLNRKETNHKYKRFYTSDRELEQLKNNFIQAVLNNKV